MLPANGNLSSCSLTGANSQLGKGQILSRKVHRREKIIALNNTTALTQIRFFKAGSILSLIKSIPPWLFLQKTKGIWRPDHGSLLSHQAEPWLSQLELFTILVLPLQPAITKVGASHYLICKDFLLEPFDSSWPSLLWYLGLHMQHGIT